MLKAELRLLIRHHKNGLKHSQLMSEAMAKPPYCDKDAVEVYDNKSIYHSARLGYWRSKDAL